MDPAGNWVFAGAWADPVSTRRAATMEGASQREERDIDEFMRLVSRAWERSVQSTLRPRDGLLKCHLRKHRRIHASTGCSPWNRDGFDSLHCSGVAAHRSGFSAAAAVRG